MRWAIHTRSPVLPKGLRVELEAVRDEYFELSVKDKAMQAALRPQIERAILGALVLAGEGVVPVLATLSGDLIDPAPGETGDVIMATVQVLAPEG